MVRRAVRLLTALNDALAADQVAAALGRGGARSAALTSAYLQMMAAMPHAGPAMQAELAALDDPGLADDAAGALAAAADPKAHLLDAATMARALAVIRHKLAGAKAPNPKMVALLGFIGQEEDWRLLQDWLASPDDAVREAAARAWARLAHTLMPLAQRAGDKVVLPILLDAATDKSDEEKVFTILVGLPQVPPALIDAWHKALELARAQKNDALAAALQQEIEFYHTKAPPGNAPR